MTHTKAIAELIVMDAKRREAKGRAHTPWFFFNLYSAVNRCERRGFAHADMVRETMSTNVAGVSGQTAARVRLSASDREEIGALVAAAGFAVQPVKISGKFGIEIGA